MEIAAVLQRSERFSLYSSLASEVLQILVGGQEEVGGQAGSACLAESVGLEEGVRVEPRKFLEKGGEDLVGIRAPVAGESPHGALVLGMSENVADDS